MRADVVELYDPRFLPGSGRRDSSAMDMDSNVMVVEPAAPAPNLFNQPRNEVVKQGRQPQQRVKRPPPPAKSLSERLGVGGGGAPSLLQRLK